jgi:hypothetical protein
MGKSRNHQNPTFKAFRPLILFVFNAKCFLCDKRNFNNHVHHLDHNSSHNDAHNLIVLCEHHHKEAHSLGFFFEPIFQHSILDQLDDINSYVKSLNLKN